MAYLEIRIAQGVRYISLDRATLRIGRLAENDIVLRDAQISRQHAELRMTSGRWRIMDLGSTNGLHVRGKRVREHHLANGDLLLLAPDITLLFCEGAAPPDAIGTHAPHAPHRAAPIHPPQSPQVAPPSSIPTPASPATRAATTPAPESDDLMRPRSPFADDEQPYFPPGMGTPAPPTHYNRQYGPGSAEESPPPMASQPYSQQPARHPSHQSAQPASAGASQMDTIPAGGYPAPAGPLISGSDGQDLFLRSSIHSRAEVHRTTSGPASTLLHVCQTCGQLTAPDSVYCQSCHHSIARECAHCRMSLLPVQERCPRCQTPNPGSVRRAHRATGA